MALGSRLKYAREKRGYSQSFIAEKIIPIDGEPQPLQGTIQKIESRDNRSSKYEDQLARILNVPLQWLKYGYGNDPFSDETTSSVVEVEQALYKSDILTRDKVVKITGRITMENDDFIITVEEIESTHGVTVSTKSEKLKAFEIVGGSFPIPFRNGWHIVIKENGEPKQGEPIILKLKNDSYIIGEYIFSTADSLDLIHLNGKTRKTVFLSDIAEYQPVTAFVAPSERKVL